MDTTQPSLLWAVRDPRDRAAWVNFYGVYAPLIAGFLRRYGVPDADADDATQEIMLIAQEALDKGTYRPDRGRFRGWLFGVARRQAMLVHRKRRRPTRAQMPPHDTGTSPLERLEDPSPEADRRLWEEEWRYALLAEGLRRVRAEVSPKEYEVFVRYALNGGAPEEIARDLGLVCSTVYVYKSRVLDALRAWVARFEEED